MFLAIDCGNTNIVFALYRDVTKAEPIIWRCQTSGKKTADEYASWLSPLLQLESVSFNDIKNILIASVVPDVNFNLCRLCDKYIGVTPEFIRNDGTNAGLQIGLPAPVKIGADQIVNAVAAIHTYGAPVVVIDFGTATTFDAVSKKGEYLGGAIFPGVQLSLEALFKNAAKLPRVEIAEPEHAIGKSTIESIHSGTVYGFISMIDGMVLKIQEELQEKARVVATGGIVDLIASKAKSIDTIDPFLTLEGLRIIHQRNQG